MATKNYIGSGKKHASYDSITVSLKMDEAQKHAFTTDKGTFLTFIVSARKEVDQYGKTHSVFVLTDAEEATTAPAAQAVAVAEPAPKKAKGTKKK